MKLFRRMAITILCLTISPSFANPIDTSFEEEDKSAAATTHETAKVGDCVIKADSTDKLWQQCAGQPVTILGQVPRIVMQHPMLAFDLEIPGSNSSRTMQSYMNVGDHQIILLTKTEMTCQEELQVKGSLEQIDLGGKKGTKESYQGWAVHVNKFMCF